MDERSEDNLSSIGDRKCHPQDEDEFENVVEGCDED